MLHFITWKFQKLIMVDEYNECIPVFEWPPPQNQCDSEEGDSKKDTTVDAIEVLPTKKLKVEFDHPLVNVAFTRWLKNNLKELKIKYKLEELQNPKTLINVLSGCEEGKTFLEREIEGLICREEKFKNDPNFYYVLTTYCDRLLQLDRSVQHITKCINLMRNEVSQILELQLEKFLVKLPTLTDFERNVLWRQQKLVLEQEMKSKAAAVEVKEMKVKVLAYNRMSPQMFSGLCLSRQPVLLTDVPPPTEQPWTEDHLRDRAGHLKVELKRRVKGSTEWAGLERGAVKTIARYLEDREEGEYLFDWSLPVHCPVLSQEFCVPPLVQDNLLTRTSQHALYHSSWPSLFIARVSWTLVRLQMKYYTCRPGLTAVFTLTPSVPTSGCI